MSYRIKRARDGAIDGDYATQELAESAMKRWIETFRADDFVVFEVTKQHRKGRAFWLMMRSRGLILQGWGEVK